MRHTNLVLLLMLGMLLGCRQPEPGLPVGETPDRDGAPEPTGGVVDAAPTATADPYLAHRETMVARGIVALGVADDIVLRAMRTVPRHAFVPPEYVDQAYENHPLPIGYGQTISQPYIVALMTESAKVGPDDNVLEVGTGSGYQAAVLAEIVGHVYTVEIIEPLAEQAAEVLASQGYGNVSVRLADGYFGWEEHAPFDAIIVTAAPDHVPQPLVEQLKPGASLIIPVGPVGGVQTLWRITLLDSGQVQSENLGLVTFVPFTRAP